jgi:hypothetical protein
MLLSQVPTVLETYRRGNYSDLLKSECFLRRYDRLFSELTTAAPVIVELGVHTGASLRLWREVFPQALVIGFDAQPPASGVPGCVLVQGQQDNRADLERIRGHASIFDFIIDDCSHLARPTRLTFDTLFPHLRHGGIYVIEDWGTGYWPTWPDGASPGSENHSAGMVGLVKQLVDVVGIPAMNRLSSPPPIHEANWSTKNSPFEWVMFYPGMACVKKALPIGEPMHAPLDHKEPSVGQRMIDLETATPPSLR